MVTKNLNLDAMSEEQLLGLKMCDLPLEIKGSWVEERVQALYRELEAKGLKFRPPVYIGDEWFTADGVSAIAVPFYLLHPKLMQLEKKMMLEVEGGDAEECLKLLRHECGHALIHAYHLVKRKDWIKSFGSPKAELRDFYRFQPYSRSYVRHLKGWYAQSHPEEDFAETFAVWADPSDDWRARYAGWPALKKLEYIDQLIPRLGATNLNVKRADMSYHLKDLTRKLSTHYQQRRKFYAEEDEGYYDEDLKRIFYSGGDQGAAGWLRKQGKSLDSAVSRWTREPRFTVHRLRANLARRAAGLGLRVGKDSEAVKLEFAAYLAALISNYVFTSHFKRKP